MGHHDRDPDDRWRREEWASEERSPEETEHKPAWNRHQWASDQPGTSPDTIAGAGGDETPADTDAGRTDLDGETADMEHISGRGKPAGESHWERVDRGR